MSPDTNAAAVRAVKAWMDRHGYKVPSEGDCNILLMSLEAQVADKVANNPSEMR